LHLLNASYCEPHNRRRADIPATRAAELHALGFRVGTPARLGIGVLSVRGEEACRLLGIVTAPIIELGGAGITVAGGLLHVFELGAVSSAVVMKVARIECAE